MIPLKELRDSHLLAHEIFLECGMLLCWKQTLHLLIFVEELLKIVILRGNTLIEMSLSGSRSGDLGGWGPRRPRPTSLQEERPRKDSGVLRRPRTTSWGGGGGGILARSMSTVSEMSNGSSAARCDYCPHTPVNAT